MFFPEWIQADTQLQVDSNCCECRDTEIVVCRFSITPNTSGSMSATAGPYSQSMDDNDNVYDSSLIEIGVQAGLAVEFKNSNATKSEGKIVFEGVDPTVTRFKLVTMRFSDGMWRKNNVRIISK